MTTTSNPEFMAAIKDIHSMSTKVTRSHNTLRFRLSDADPNLEAFPAIQRLADSGASVKVYTRRSIFTACGGSWRRRRTPKVREYATVEVAF